MMPEAVVIQEVWFPIKVHLLHGNGVVEAFINGQVDFQHAERRKAVKVYIEPANSYMCCEY